MWVDLKWGCCLASPPFKCSCNAPNGETHACVQEHGSCWCFLRSLLDSCSVGYPRSCLVQTATTALCIDYGR